LIERALSDDITCTDVENRDLVAGYVSHSLTEPDAEAFERHYLGCARCWADLQLACSIRIATSGTAAPAGARSRRRLYMVLPFAAAAMVMLAVILWERQRTLEPEDPVRTSASDPLQVTVVPTASSAQLRWSPIAGAARYRVRVSAPDGTPLVARETAASSFDLPRDDLPAGIAAVIVVVEAFDVLGNSVATSSHVTVTLPPR
jgi:hypothetical protein